MLDLVLKLIDRCINLAETREKGKRELFKDFVEPTFADFEAVHKNYIYSFKKYREVLRNETIPCNTAHPVFVMIAEDNLFSDDTRAKLWSQFEDPRGPLVDFRKSIYRYLWNVEPELELHHSQLHRTNYKEFLEAAFRDNRPVWKIGDIRLSESYSDLVKEYGDNPFRDHPDKILSCDDYPEVEKRNAALCKADAIVAGLQRSYSHVVKEYNRLKRGLLWPLKGPYSWL